MTATPLNKILVCGSGLAFEVVLAALVNALPKDIDITAIELGSSNDSDIFYGTVMAPTAYNDHLTLGLTEPELLTQTDTSFSYGTHYENWANTHSWTQSHHLPLPVWNGIEFHFYLMYLQETLEPYLIGSICGQKGRFAHPPQDEKIPLSKAEYGYQFSPDNLAQLLAKRNDTGRIKRIRGNIETIQVHDGKIQSIELTDGQSLSAHLFIDTTGPSAKLMKALGNVFKTKRRLKAAEFSQPQKSLGGALRRLRGEPYGWQSVTGLQNKTSHLAVFDPEQENEIDPNFVSQPNISLIDIDTGERTQGWHSNCVGIGHVNYIVEPLTPAPMTMLYRDIKRLIELIPISTKMHIEAKEFNRLLKNDIEHCGIFSDAFYEVKVSPDTPYWRAAKAKTPSQKLTRKIKQFESRGLLTSYDLEPFNKEDWSILHFGMKRKPTRQHPAFENPDLRGVESKLKQMKKSIEELSLRVPPHDRYLNNFLRYLEKKHASNS